MASSHNYNISTKRRITIHKNPEELYHAWRDPGKLVNFLSGATEVHVLDDRRSRWTSEVSGKGCISWEAEVITERANNAISWRTVDGSGFDHIGSVQFTTAPNGLGTEVGLEIRTKVTGGRLGRAIARMLGRSPEDYVSQTLHNFKQFMETGEVATNKGPSGRENAPENRCAEGGEQ